MGRLPSHWGNRIITEREPYELYGELSLTASQRAIQFPDTTFANNTNKPFEIHRVIPRVVAQDTTQIPVSPQVAQELLASLVKLRMVDVGLNYEMTKNPTMIEAMVKGSSERTWEWADPHYLVTSNQIVVSVDIAAFPVAGAEPFSELEIVRLLTCITFQGFFITVAPAGDNR